MFVWALFNVLSPRDDSVLALILAVLGASPKYRIVRGAVFRKYVIIEYERLSALFICSNE